MLPDVSRVVALIHHLRIDPRAGFRCSAKAWHSLALKATCDQGSMPMVTLFYDVIEPSGLKRAIVFWDDSSAEVFLGQRYEGVWQIDQERDIEIQLPQGGIAFRLPG